MTIKTVSGVDVTLMDDDQGNCVYFPNPAKEATKMGLWNDLFGEAPAKIMRANYLSHAKNGYKDANGNKVRNIRDLEGNVLKEMELKDESDKSTSGSTKIATPAVSLSDAIAVYKEITKMNNPQLAKAVEIQMTIIKSLINPVFLEADIDTLLFIVDLKKAEAKATATAEKVA